MMLSARTMAVVAQSVLMSPSAGQPRSSRFSAPGHASFSWLQRQRLSSKKHKKKKQPVVPWPCCTYSQVQWARVEAPRAPLYPQTFQVAKLTQSRGLQAPGWSTDILPKPKIQSPTHKRVWGSRKPHKLNTCSCSVKLDYLQSRVWCGVWGVRHIKNSLWCERVVRGVLLVCFTTSGCTPAQSEIAVQNQ